MTLPRIIVEPRDRTSPTSHDLSPSHGISMLKEGVSRKDFASVRYLFPWQREAIPDKWPHDVRFRPVNHHHHHSNQTTMLDLSNRIRQLADISNRRRRLAQILPASPSSRSKNPRQSICQTHSEFFAGTFRPTSELDLLGNRGATAAALERPATDPLGGQHHHHHHHPKSLKRPYWHRNEEGFGLPREKNVLSLQPIARNAREFPNDRYQQKPISRPLPPTSRVVPVEEAHGDDDNAKKDRKVATLPSYASLETRQERKDFGINLPAVSIYGESVKTSFEEHLEERDPPLPVGGCRNSKTTDEDFTKASNTATFQSTCGSDANEGKTLVLPTGVGLPAAEDAAIPGAAAAAAAAASMHLKISDENIVKSTSDVEREDAKLRKAPNDEIKAKGNNVNLKDARSNSQKTIVADDSKISQITVEESSTSIEPKASPEVELKTCVNVSKVGPESLNQCTTRTDTETKHLLELGAEEHLATHKHIESTMTEIKNLQQGNSEIPSEPSAVLETVSTIPETEAAKKILDMNKETAKDDCKSEIKSSAAQDLTEESKTTTEMKSTGDESTVEAKSTQEREEIKTSISSEASIPNATQVKVNKRQVLPPSTETKNSKSRQRFKSTYKTSKSIKPNYCKKQTQHQSSGVQHRESKTDNSAEKKAKSTPARFYRKPNLIISRTDSNGRKKTDPGKDAKGSTERPDRLHHATGPSKRQMKSVLRRSSAPKIQVRKNVQFRENLELVRIVTKIEYPWYEERRKKREAIRKKAAAEEDDDNDDEEEEDDDDEEEEEEEEENSEGDSDSGHDSSEEDKDKEAGVTNTKD